MRDLMTRRIFAKFFTAAAGTAVASAQMIGAIADSAVTTSAVSAKTRRARTQARATGDDNLQSEFLLDLVLDRGLANNVGPVGVNRVVVPVLGGTFEGPKLKGAVIGPSGDWIVARPDGSSVLDLRLLLQTDDAQKIYMACRGIAYTLPGGTLFARILPMFETGAAKYLWLNNAVAAGVYRPMPEKVAYRIYRIL
jgi:Protein of unknown function (DUF3237)